MSNSWFNSLLLALGLQMRREQKAERTRQEFLRQRREELIHAITALQEILATLILESGPIGLPTEIVESTKLVPLYAMGEVLSAQGAVLPEQEAVLKTFITQFNPVYNYAQYIQAVINRTGLYEQYWDILALEEDHCGTFWQTLFELIYRTRLLDAIQTIDNQLSLIVVNFAFLGDPEATIMEPICNRMLNHLNRNVNSCQQTPRIHALMLLQQVLLEQRNLKIEDHFLLEDTDIVQDGRKFYVFTVHEKTSLAFCGKFAVRAIKCTADGRLDYKNDLDVIDRWNDTKHEYELFYQV